MTVQWRQILAAGTLAALLALPAGCAGPAAGETVPPSLAAVQTPAPSFGEGVVLTVDGYPVTEEEFMLFLQEERALTAARFMADYGVTADAGFWDREFDGRTPNEYAREAALQQAVLAKIEAILCKERGIADDISFEGLMAELEKANAERAEKLETGEVFYGLTEYDSATYYVYVRNNRWGELVRSQTEYANPTQEELRAIYEGKPDYFTELDAFLCRFAYPDGREEELEISYATVHKEDASGAALLSMLSEAEPGVCIVGASYGGEEADVTLLEVTRGELLPFEDENVQAILKSLYEEDSLRALVQERARNAQVSINEPLYQQQTLSTTT